MSKPTDTRAVDWNELGVTELPTGTVTLLLADVEGSTRLWETQADQMKAAIADETGAQTGVPEVFECLGATASQANRIHEAARLFGAADGI
ncbi:hypothetical protein, partial [Mycolicibacter arupensis]|uniref:hypothetical protein n=1 Tax=Mycolicibacter arupensis TaxID=342002 RepID=UPI003B3A4B95